MVMYSAAVVSEYKEQNSGKIERVTSCSDCCRELNPDGTVNIVGAAFRAERQRVLSDGTVYTDCQWCPVTQNMSDDEWNAVLNAIDSSE